MLQSCLVYVNTLFIQEVRDEPAWRNRMSVEDWRGLTPLIYHHVNPYGRIEFQIVVRGREHPALLDKLQRFLEEIDAIVTPFDEPQARVVADAFQRYGKGQGHPAQLNMGDCAVYALAKSVNEPLLFVGNDFAQTDVERC